MGWGLLPPIAKFLTLLSLYPIMEGKWVLIDGGLVNDNSRVMVPAVDKRSQCV
jgi:hypothetical protein